ncbi:ferritin-like domain-containing protein [Histophilus somni]|uniref:ferritin-like domain-containing protein n=1 Tax=Histophilus somni TaxID=731 RepID=UPI00201EDBAA|nr:ferritin-like domain-containing protein [Histophilus somni]
MTALSTQDFWHKITTALAETNPYEKCRLVNQLYDEILPEINLDKTEDFPLITPEQEIVGIPHKPFLVAPQNVPKRSFATNEGYAATLHAIAHIEFNAINLGLDAAWRFGRNAQEELKQGMLFIQDWLRVAREESTHFTLVNEHLKTLGYQYGDFEAHAGLWEMAQATAHDIWERMALVPRVLEARGLDANPILQEKIAQRKDVEAVAILDIILRDEIGHVSIGNHWYHALSVKRQLDAMKCFSELLRKYRIVIFKGVINTDARIQAGFTQYELDWIYEIEQTLKSHIKNN